MDQCCSVRRASHQKLYRQLEHEEQLAELAPRRGAGTIVAKQRQKGTNTAGQLGTRQHRHGMHGMSNTVYHVLSAAPLSPLWAHGVPQLCSSQECAADPRMGLHRIRAALQDVL